MYLEKIISKMLMEPNCILLGKTSLNDSFTVGVCNKNDINGKEVLFEQLKISGLKYLIYVEIKKYGININNDNYNELNLWKADITFGDKLKNLTEEQIFKNSEQLLPVTHFKKYFQDQDAVDESLIFVEVPTGPSQQGVTQVTTPEPKAIFEEFLGSKHGVFLKTYIERNDPLPSYESTHIKTTTTIPASFSGERPSLLKYNLPGGNDGHEPITRVSDVQSAIAGAKNNLLVFLGTSGCGKTRTCYELLCENWGLYFVASRKGNGGSADIEKIQSHLYANMTDDFDINRKYTLEIMRCAILSRLLILRYCLKNAPAFNKQRWLLIQICQDTFGKLYNYNDDMFVALMFQLNTCTPSSVTTYIDNIYQEITCTPSSVMTYIDNIYQETSDEKKNKTFVIILDETQVLEKVLKGKFKSRTSGGERSLLSPVIQALREPTPSIVNHCVIPCGTGLGILSLDDVLITGISKPDTEISKFTEFGGWQDIAHVKNYVNNLVNLTENEYNHLYNHFRGRFRPIITCVEDIIMGSSAEDAVNANWKILTRDNDNNQSLYNQLYRIIKMERPNHVNSINILNLYKSITLAYYYSGGPFLFTDKSQMSLVESGLGRLRFINPPTISHLKKECKGVDEDKLLISSVNVDLLHPALEGRRSLVAYVDEPFALTASFNFFKDYDSLPKEILNIMSIVNNASSWGTLWETYLTDEFERMFNGELDVVNMPVFAEVLKKYNLPAFCIGSSPKISKSSDDTVPRVANASAGYTLEKFFDESPETRPIFYFPEDRCGPDLIFFVKFEEVTVPVFVQMKLRYSVKEMAGALSTIHPEMFYKDKNGKVYNEKSNKHIIDKIIEICKVGSIGILVAYPADVFQESYVTNDHPHHLRDRSSNQHQQLIGIIDIKNASTVFQKEHLQFLNELKGTAKRKGVVDEEEKADKVGENSKSKKQKKHSN